jgi:hypothetical protein
LLPAKAVAQPTLHPAFIAELATSVPLTPWQQNP